MKFYQRPVTNYKLECSQDPERSIYYLENMQWIKRDRAVEDSTMPFLIERVNTLSKAAICVLMIVPFASFCATALFTPLAVITAWGMYCALISYVDDALPTMEALRDAYNIPSWLNNCLDGAPIK